MLCTEDMGGHNKISQYPAICKSKVVMIFKAGYADIYRALEKLIEKNASDSMRLNSHFRDRQCI